MEVKSCLYQSAARFEPIGSSLGIYIYIYMHHRVIRHICVVTRWRSWLRHSATGQKVAGSIPYGVVIFHSRNPSVRTVALGLTQPLTEMSTRNISLG